MAPVPFPSLPGLSRQSNMDPRDKPEGDGGGKFIFPKVPNRIGEETRP
jgi:hypothetical protein